MVPTIHNQIDANRRKTLLVMVLFTIFVVVVAYIFSQALDLGIGLIGIALIVIGIANYTSYYYSDKIVLGVSGAKQIEKKDNQKLFRTVENLCIASGLPLPKVYIIEDSAPNAFATGRDPNHAAVAVTTGLLDKLDDLELEGVIGHELSHIKNFDTRLMAVITILVGMIALVADWFLRITWWGGRSRDNDRGSAGTVFFVLALIAAILAPIVGMMMQLAISRRREFLADSSGALLTRYPEGLAKALLKISMDREPLEVANRATAHLYITNPLKGQSGVGWFAGLFSTHPKIEDRVKALREMAV